MLRARTRSLVLASAIAGLATVAVAQDAPTTAPAKAPAAAKDLAPANEIIEKSVEAVGGKAALDKIKSVSFTLEMAQSMGPVVVMHVKSARPDKMLVDTTVGGMQMTMGSSGDVMWSNNPMQGYTLLPESQRGQTQMLNPFQLYFDMDEDVASDRFTTIDRLPFGDVDCYKVRMASEDEPDLFAFFDVESGLLSGLEQTTQSPMGEMVSVIHFGDYKEVEGVKMFTSAQVEAQQQQVNLSYKDIVVNKVDPAEFELPEEVKALLAAKSAPTSQPADDGE